MRTTKRIASQSSVASFAYNGLGDRLSQTANGVQTRYALDPAAGLTQVLSDGSSAYLYDQGRIAQYQTAMQYFGADALGSVRQLYNASGQVIANARYDPYGNVLAQSGATSAYGYTGEQTDATGLEYLRARYYFDNTAFLIATLDSIYEGDPVRFGIEVPRLSITHFLGTFDYSFSRLADNAVRFQVDNDTTLASGSRVPPLLGGVPPQEEERALSVEELIGRDRNLAGMPLDKVIREYPVVSILSAKERTQLGLFEGGGTMRQTFRWREEYLWFACDKLPPWPLVNSFVIISYAGPDQLE